MSRLPLMESLAWNWKACAVPAHIIAIKAIRNAFLDMVFIGWLPPPTVR